jgi:hypothetical protein
MKSVNIKRVAALATGVAMVGSVMASGLAAVTLNPTSDAVNTLVDNIKANLGSVQVVLGENGADIEDGYNAARIVAALADARLTPQTDVTLTGVEDLGTGNELVKVSSTGGGAGGGLTVEPDQFDVQYTAQQTTLGQQNYRTNTRAGGATITPIALSDVLTDGEVEAYIGNTLQKYKYREQVVLGSANYITYAESQTPAGHGLYYYCPFSAGTSANGINYQIDFRISGNGLPTNATYQKIPLIIMLGTEYAIDTVAFSQTTPQFHLYAGEEVTLSSGQTFETDTGYKITLTSVGLSSTNTVIAQIQAKNPDGAIQTTSLQALQGWDFFNNQLSVYIETACTACYIEENVATGQIVARIGTGKRYFNVGAPFPLDNRWTVRALNYSGTVAATGYNYLQVVDLVYGNPALTDPIQIGNFLGSELTGLKEGVVIDGPHNEEGLALFNIQLSGFGGTTKIDTTTLTVSAVGDDTAGTDTFNLKWTGVGGHSNEFLPATKGHIATIGGSGAIPKGYVNFTTGTSPGPWFFVNNYSAYFAGVYTEQGISSHYAADFYIGGYPNGQKVRTTSNTTVPNHAGGTSANVTLEYVDVVGTTRCRVNLTSMSAGSIEGIKGDAAGSLNCDLWPDNIQLGAINVLDLGRPWFNATNISDAMAQGAAGTTLVTRPLIGIHEPIAYNGGNTWNQGAAVLFDSSTSTDYTGSTTAAGATPTGLVIFNTTIDGNGTDLNYSAPNATYVNTALLSATENDLYAITPIGTRISAVGGEGSREVTFIMPEGATGFTMNGIVTVAEVIHEDDDGGDTGTIQTLGVGDTIDGVTIEDITADVTGTDNLACGGVAGATYYTKGPWNSNIVVVGKSQATATYKIVVGGPWVSSLAADIDTTGMTTETGAQYLIASGNNLLCAGQTASDTTAATSQLVSLLTA